MSDNDERKIQIKIMVENMNVLRAKSSLTQEELADKIGVSRQTIIAIEKGSRNMTWSNFLALMMIFISDDKTKQFLPVIGLNISN